MPIWERYQNQGTVVAEGNHVNILTLNNEEDTDNFQNADLVFVDGILTVLTDTDDLVGVRLLVLHDSILTATITEDDPTPDDRAVWYTFFCGRGPLVFRLRSKKTLPSRHNLWLQYWKASGSTSTIVRTGVMVLMQLKH